MDVTLISGGGVNAPQKSHYGKTTKLGYKILNIHQITELYGIALTLFSHEISMSIDSYRKPVST